MRRADHKDLDPSDAALRRQVLVYWTGGKRVALSAADQDSHSPRFAHAGDRVVFVTARPEGPPAGRRFALEVVDVASGRRRPLAALRPVQGAPLASVLAGVVALPRL